jgi:DNA-binding NtrC family response regulator
MPLSATAPRPDILLVEDAASLRAIYDAHLRQSGLSTCTAATAADALTLFQRHRCPVVLLDLMLPDRNGFELMAEILALAPDTAVVILTADHSTQSAVRAMRGGALDFLVKPIEETRLMGAIENARRHAGRLPRGPVAGPGPAPVGAFIGRSARMQQVYDRIRAASRSVAPVFISGEIGTGKKMAAQTIHTLSERADTPFRALDCAAITPEQLTQEVFGTSHGLRAETLVQLDTPGGTLFLDNIDEMSPALQSCLLDILQNRGGESGSLPRDLRLVSACTLPPLEAVAQDRLRKDLFYRLNVLPLRMIPLRERREDIGLIARTLLARLAAEEDRDFLRLSTAAIALMEAHPWPGNIREMLNALRSAMVLHDGPELTPEMLPPEMAGQAGARPAPEGLQLSTLSGQPLAEIERIVIRDALARHQGAVVRAAAELGIAPSTIYRKLEGWRKD